LTEIYLCTADKSPRLSGADKTAIHQIIATLRHPTNVDPIHKAAGVFPHRGHPRRHLNRERAMPRAREQLAGISMRRAEGFGCQSFLRRCWAA
jgi:hypothetical protein